MGFDILELSIENPEMIDLDQVKTDLKANALETIVCGAFGPERNLCSDKPGVVENAKTYIRWLIDAAEFLGSPVICGPMYSAVGKDHLEEQVARTREWNRAVLVIREMAEYAKPRGIRLAMETLNRFETDMLNVVSQGLEFIHQTGMDNVGLHLDTFHMQSGRKG